MTIFGTYNIKGGVGKTTATVNLAWLSARDGFRTLVWDLDAQGAASFYFRVKPKVKGGSKALLKRKHVFAEQIKGTDFENLDLLPADFTYRYMDLILDDSKHSTERLSRVLAPITPDYDHIFLDCPPSISLLSENVFNASDVLLVPIIPTTLSLRTLHQLGEFLQRKEIQRPKVMPFFSLVDRRRKLHRDIMEQLPLKVGGMLSTPIPNASEVERMGIHRAPLGSFGNRWPALAYELLWGEIKGRLGYAKKPCTDSKTLTLASPSYRT